MRICGASAAPDAVWSSDEGCGRGSCTSGPHWILARLRDETFFSLGALNQAIRVLLDELNDRPLKKLGVSRRALYEQLDRPGLQPLPATRYVLAQWRLCRLNIDYHVIVERHAYSVPFQLLPRHLGDNIHPARRAQFAREGAVAPVHALVGDKLLIVQTGAYNRVEQKVA